MNNYSYGLDTGNSWSGAYFDRSTNFCSRNASDWIIQAYNAQTNNQTINSYVVANYLVTYLNYQVGGACAALGVRVAMSGMQTSYMVPAEDAGNSKCNGGPDSFNSLVVSQKPLYVTTFYNYVSGTDGGPVLCSPPPI